jgi:hypothetical protein
MKKSGLFFAIFISILFGVSASFGASGWVPFSSSQLAAIQTGSGFAYPEVSLLTSNSNELILEINFPGMVTEDIVKNEIIYQTLFIPGGGKTCNLGWPELPTFGRFVAVPFGAEPQIEVLDYSLQSLSGYNVYPVQEQLVDKGEAPPPEFVKDVDFYQQNEFYPDRMAFVEEPKIIRGCPVSLFILFPVQYNPATKELRVCSYMRVRISFVGGSGVFIDPAHRSPYFEPLYQNLLLNYSSLGTPSLLGGKSDTGCDFLIITHPNFQAWAESLAFWKNQSGISTWVRNTTQTGSDTGSIRNYIQNAYTTWTPPPSFVLLIGDAEFIPVFYRTTHPYDGYKTGTDLYYSTVEGSDWFPDIYMGRISVDSASQARTVVTKILNYERNPISTPTSFYNNVLVAGYFQDDYSPYDWEDRFFIKTSEVVRDFLLSQGYSVERCYDKTSGSNPCCYYYGDPLPPGLTWNGNAVQISNAINNGVFLVNHRDHGSTDGWGDPQYLVSNVNGLANGDKLPVVFSINCETGHFDNETDASGNNTPYNSVCFCEAFQRKANGGAVGVFGLTRVSYSGYNDELCKGLYDGMWTNFDPSYPNAGSTHPIYSPLFRMGAVLNFGKFWMYDKYYLTGGSGYPWGADLTETKITFEMGHWFGDPTLEIWTSIPESLDVTHPEFVVLGGAPFPVTVNLNGQPVKDGLVCLIKDTEVYEVGRTDSTGEVTLYPFPLTPGNAELTITAHNAFPYETTLPVVGGAYIVFDRWYVDDDSSDESLGNSDGDVDLGETIELPIVLKNMGDSTALNVVATLSTTNPFITLTDNQETYGNIPAHDTVRCPDDFGFVVSPQIEDSTQVTFQLDITATNDSWIYRDLSLLVHAPVLVYDSKIINEIGGNGNGEPDPGETCNMTVNLKNEGSQKAVQVSADLICNDPYLTVTASNSGYPDIPPDNSGSSLVPYKFNAHTNCPPGYVATFVLEISGAGPYSVSDTFHISIGRKPVLLVDDDDGASFDTFFVSALNSSEILCDVWTYKSSGSPSDSVLSSYQAVVWTTGEDFGSIGNPSTLTLVDQANLQVYLDNGGKLFLSSQDLLYDNDPNDFIINYLHVTGHNDDQGINSVAGVSGDTITDGMSISLSYPFSNLSDYIVSGSGAAGIFYRTGKNAPLSRSQGSRSAGDGILTLPSIELDKGDQTNYCALRYPASGSSTYKVVFFAFPFEAIPQSGTDPNNARTVMERIMNWFGIGKPSFARGDANGDGEINSGDIVYLINYLFIGGPAPSPLEAGDADCNGKIDASDVIFLINYLFIDGPAPGCP